LPAFPTALVVVFGRLKSDFDTGFLPDKSGVRTGFAEKMGFATFLPNKKSKNNWFFSYWNKF
jgi:hypothetical protein